LDTSRVVSHRIEHTAAGDNGNSHAIDFGIEQVGPVTAGVHPLIVNPRRTWTDGYILLNQAEVRFGLTGTFGEVELAGVTVRDWTLGRHAKAMFSSRNGQRAIPFEGPGSRSLSRLVCQSHQLLGI
jgi:hypothetical protein